MSIIYYAEVTTTDGQRYLLGYDEEKTGTCDVVILKLLKVKEK